jgi:tetratricopeptide (TPR) repeat protein
MLALCAAAAFALELFGFARTEPRNLLDWDRANRQTDKLIAAGRFAEALPAALEARQHQPTDATALRHLARLYAGLGRLADEATVWEQFLAIAPATDDVCVRLADVYRRLSQPARVIATVDRCEPIDPRQREFARDRAAAHATMDGSQ